MVPCVIRCCISSSAVEVISVNFAASYIWKQWLEKRFYMAFGSEGSGTCVINCNVLLFSFLFAIYRFNRILRSCTDTHISVSWSISCSSNYFKQEFNDNILKIFIFFRVNITLKVIILKINKFIKHDRILDKSTLSYSYTYIIEQQPTIWSAGNISNNFKSN